MLLCCCFAILLALVSGRSPVAGAGIVGFFVALVMVLAFVRGCQPVNSRSTISSKVLQLGLWQLAILAFVGINYLNASNALIEFASLPSLNKILVPLLILYVLYQTLSGKKLAAGTVLAVAIALVFYVIASISLLSASYPAVVQESLAVLRKDLIMMVLVVSLLSSTTDVRLALFAVVAGAVLLSVLGIVSYITGNTGQEFVGFARWVYQIDGNGLYDMRISGPVGDPNFFAQILLLAYPIAIYFALRSQQLATKIAFTVAIVLIVVCILATQSRGGLLVLGFISLLSFFIMVPSRRVKTAAVAGVSILVVLMLAISPPEFKTRIADGFNSIDAALSGEAIGDEAARGRWYEMLAALSMFQENPLLGVGYGTYSKHYQDYTLKDGYSVRGLDRDSHSLYLEIAAEMGLFGLTGFFAILFALLFRALRIINLARALNDRDSAAFVYSIVLGFSGYLMAAILLHDAYHRYFWLMLGIVIAVTQVPFRFYERPGRRSNKL